MTVAYSKDGKGDKPKPQLSDTSGLVEQVGYAVEEADGGRYKFTIRAVKPGQSTLWIYCGDKSQSVAIKCQFG